MQHYVLSWANKAHPFRENYLDICWRGYSVLNLSPDIEDQTLNPWHYQSAFLPSYFAFGRYRFLRTLELAKSLKPESILDIACGDGFLSACLATPDRRTVINDLRLDESQINKWKTNEHLERAPGNLFDLKPSSLGTFDLIMACEIIEHIAHGDEFIKHLKAFLAPEGSLLLTTPNGEYFRSKLPTYSKIENFLELEGKQFKPDADGHLYLYTCDEIEKILQSAGFDTISIYILSSPWISGHCGFRYFMKCKRLNPIYYNFNSTFEKLPRWITRLICNQLIVIATNK